MIPAVQKRRLAAQRKAKRLMKRKQIRRSGLVYTSGDLWLTLPDEQDMAMAAAELTVPHLQRALRKGKDAAGNRYTLAESTIARRQRDMQPPENPRSKRWQQRYRKTGGSKGGTMPFLDSGLLIDGLEAVRRGKGAVVIPVNARKRAVNVLVHQGFFALGVVPEALEELVRFYVDGSLETKRGRKA